MRSTLRGLAVMGMTALIVGSLIAALLLFSAGHLWLGVLVGMPFWGISLMILLYVAWEIGGR